MCFKVAPKLCFIITALTNLCVAAKSDQVAVNSKPHDSNGKNGLVFNPCKSNSAKLTPSLKKAMKSHLGAIMSTCGLRVVTLAGTLWGSPKNVIRFIPHLLHVTCFIIRVSYAPFVNNAGRLPCALASNGTRLYELGEALFKIILTDHSVTDKMCAHNVQRGNGSICYEKKTIHDAAFLLISCVRSVLKGTAPELVDLALLGVSALLKRLGSSRLLAYTRK